MAGFPTIPANLGTGGSALAPVNGGTPTLAQLLQQMIDALSATTAGNGAHIVGYSGAYASVGLALDALVAGFPAPASVNGGHLAVVADGQVLGGIEVIHPVHVPTGVSADIDVVLTDKTEVLDVWVRKENGAGGAADTITVKNGATAITDAMDINKADKTITRVATIDDAQATIAAGGTLRIAMVNGGGHDTTCTVYVRGIRRA